MLRIKNQFKQVKQGKHFQFDYLPFFIYLTFDLFEWRA